MDLILITLVGYILGSISFAVIVSKCYGVNILKEGSCNPGATNVKRVVGKLPGNLVFFLDFLKGFAAAHICLLFGHSMTFWPVVAGLVGAVIGHSFSIFLKFKGGKAVASVMGGTLALMPTPLGIGLAVWIIVFYLFKYVSLASLMFGLSLPVSAYFIGLNLHYIVFGLLIALFLLIRHRSNIIRLINRTEPRFK